MKAKMNELETNSKSKNIRYCTGASINLKGAGSFQLIY
jgi:hypothetical protein